MKPCIYANGSQAAQGVALYLGIVPKEYEQQVADNLSTMIKANIFIVLHNGLIFASLYTSIKPPFFCFN